MPSAALILLHARRARSPEFALALASRMAATALARHDLDGVDRWSRCCHELSRSPGEVGADAGTDAGTEPPAARA